VSTGGLQVSPRSCDTPHCGNDGTVEYQLRGHTTPFWLCEACLRLAKIAASEDGALGDLSRDG